MQAGDVRVALERLALTLGDPERAEELCRRAGQHTYVMLLEVLLHPTDGQAPLYTEACRLLSSHGESPRVSESCLLFSSYDRLDLSSRHLIACQHFCHPIGQVLLLTVC